MAAIYLIRHGQARFGEADYDQLSVRGVKQSQTLGEALSQVGIQVELAVCGGMRRHHQTSEHVLGSMRAPVQRLIDPDWNEYDHQEVISAYRPDYADPDLLRRDMMSMPDPHRAFQSMFKRAASRWMSGEHDIDYHETWTAFRGRCGRALRKLQDRISETGENALVFTSGGPVAAVVKDLLDLTDARCAELSWTLVNCGMTKLIVGKHNVHLSVLNDHTHFEGDQAGLLTYR
ncbi:histidine phosphatase family protein [Paraburkholderia sp. UYCP14C]|uniref:histidine phosphatase family protein n=1 Tax=Paraburkholderia sp. UYCP14C TaxID=2511130 RepID=UPI00101FE5ED|nr:histidine phosphatase family protein [Paraburkholderia sp. UYCP14C]RZF25420.1 histidine phosphatase family protein [Paraburkholderia sp. UYCP14C]